MRVAILAAAAAALATTAHAGTAGCGGVLDRTPSCAVAPKPPASAPAHPDPAAAHPVIDPRSVPPYACNFAQKITLGPAECQARRIAEDRRQVGAMIAARRCDAAATAARETGDAEFADRVAEACAERIHAASPGRAAAP